MPWPKMERKGIASAGYSISLSAGLKLNNVSLACQRSFKSRALVKAESFRAEHHTALQIFNSPLQ